MDRDKALEMALGQIDKQFGKGSVMRMGDKPIEAMDVVSTGALSLDIALGIGGLPRGRVVEIYGPESSGKTSLAMHVVAEAQRNGGICAYIDAEHAVDPLYARAIGVDIDNLLISQPDTGEQALEIADMLIRSGALDVLVIDSVAALTPRAEIEGEMGDTHVGLQARLMSQALRKLTANLNRSQTICVFINQLREKIGVMFGCFSAESRVTLADGTQEEIGRIVEHRMPVEVLSYDPELGRVVPKAVVGWFDNGPTHRFLTVTVAAADGATPATFSCTPGHRIRTPGGWRPAGQLVAGDRVLQAVTHHLSDLQWQVVLGALVGNAELVPPGGGGGRTCLRWAHRPSEAGYGDWKGTLLANLGPDRSQGPDGEVVHRLAPLAELAELGAALHAGGDKILNHDHLKALTPLALAIWYLDRRAAPGAGGEGPEEVDLGGIEPTSRLRLRDHLADTWGVRGRVVGGEGGHRPVLRLSREAAARLHALVAPFVPAAMQDRLPARHRGRFALRPVFAPPRPGLVPVPVTGIGERPSPGPAHRFDIEVEGTHNYFVEGVMVHNSPETTPGGRALKFYSSVRLDIRRIEAIKDGVEVVGNRTRVKVVKNKCASPFRQAEFDIMYGRGISREGSVLDVAVDLGLVKKSGAWYTYEGEQLGQGREKVKEFLAESPELMIELHEKVRAAKGIGVPIEVPLGQGVGDDDPISLE